jgi:quinol monooxygenase YgiN
MIFVIAAIEVKPGTRDEFLADFHKLVPLVHAEEGCIEYGPTIDLETNFAALPESRENIVTVVEKWESLCHLEDHLIAPHMLEYRAKVKAIVVSTAIQVLEPA